VRSALHYAYDYAYDYVRSYRFGVFAAIAAGWLAVSAPAAEVMPTAQQNALVQKYCAVCHTDAADNGGLSLEHFDSAQAPPSLMAMLLSKLTGGVSLEMVKEAPSNAGAAALVDKKMKSGAMGAAGIPIPDKATIDALIQALAAESDSATEWTVQHTNGAAGSVPVIVASILREKLLAKSTGEARVYRLIVSCNAATQHGSMQMAWAPLPQKGTLAASVDGRAMVTYQLDGSEKMGNGSGVVTQGQAAVVLADAKYDMVAGLALPAETLTIRDLSPDETVFSFANLPQEAQREFQACFSGAGRSNR
jgi:hypothetical protein